MIEFDLVGTPLEGPAGRNGINGTNGIDGVDGAKGYLHLVDLSAIDGPQAIGSGSYLLVPISMTEPSMLVEDRVDVTIPYNNPAKRIAMFATAKQDGVDLVIGIAGEEILVPINRTVPAITGNFVAGETLSVSNGTWDNSPVSYAYQWFLNDTPVVGGTSQTYTTALSQIGQTLSVEVRAINAEGSSEAIPATGADFLQDPGSVFPDWEYLPFKYVWINDLTHLGLSTTVVNPSISVQAQFEAGISLKRRSVDESAATYTSTWTSTTGADITPAGTATTSHLVANNTAYTHNGRFIILNRSNGLVSPAAGLVFNQASHAETPARIRLSARAYPHAANNTTTLLAIGEEGECEVALGIHWSNALFFRYRVGDTVRTFYTPATLIKDFNPHNDFNLMEVEWVNDPEGNGGSVSFYVNGQRFGIVEATLEKIKITTGSKFYSNSVLGNYTTSVDGLEIDYLKVAYKRLDPVITYVAVNNGTITQDAFENLYVDTRGITTDKGNQRLNYTINGVGDHMLIVPSGFKGTPPPANPFRILDRGSDHPTILDALWYIGDGTATILIQPGVYTESFAQQAGSVTYLGSEDGPVIFDGGIAEQKACFVLRGTESIVKNIEFRNMKGPETNEAAIRQESDALLVDNCTFRNCYNGVLIGGERENTFITVKNSYFTRCGYTDGGPAHSMYIGRINTFVVQSCRFDRGTGGHYVKCRGRVINFFDNIIDDTYGQGSNYHIDLSNGSSGSINDNEFIQGRYKENSMALVTISPEGQLQTADGLQVFNNKVSFAEYPANWSWPTLFVCNWNTDDVDVYDNEIAQGFTPYVDNYGHRG